MENDIQSLYEITDRLKSEIERLTISLNLQQDRKVTFDSITDYESRKSVINTAREFATPTPITAIANQTVFPHSQILIITAAAAITLGSTTSIADGYFPGQPLTIIGTSDSNTITINDNTNTKMAGNVTLGVSDSITFLWDKTDWIETSRSNN